MNVATDDLAQVSAALQMGHVRTRVADANSDAARARAGVIS